MASYSALATWYNELTEDIPYDAFIRYYESAFARHNGKFKLILDLCCGTGTLSKKLSQRGYDVIAIDASEEMLTVAENETKNLANPPFLIHQNVQELDLFGTVDAAICALDSFNYIPPDDLSLVFQRLRLFIRPGGLFYLTSNFPALLFLLMARLLLMNVKMYFAYGKQILKRMEKLCAIAWTFFPILVKAFGKRRLRNMLNIYISQKKYIPC